MIVLFAAVAIVAASPPVPATCATLPAVFAAAHAGEAIVVTGTCAAVVELRDRTFAPAVSIDATAAIFQGGLFIFKAGGIHVAGGQYGPQASGGTGISAYVATDVTFAAARVTGMDFGAAFTQAHNVGISSSRLDFIRNDGIRLFNVQHGSATGNFVMELHPAASADHPDCIQAASDGGATNPALISSDLTITDNECVGDGQGITAFQSGADDGGYDRLDIERNRVRTSYPLGMAIYGCRGCTVIDNDIGALPLAPHVVQANVVNATGGKVCGNLSSRMAEATTLACPAEGDGR